MKKERATVNPDVEMFSYSDTRGGASRAASRIHRAVRSVGVDSRLVVRRARGVAEMSEGAGGLLSRIDGFIRNKVEQLPVALYGQRRPLIFSPGLLAGSARGRLRRSTAPIVHVHWLPAAYLGSADLQSVSRPIVWTLHDMWPFTGGCHSALDCRAYETSCAQCPALGSTHRRDLAWLSFIHKRRAWRGLDLSIVAVSSWLAGASRASALLGRFPTHVIPNAIDLERFRPYPKVAAREALGLPQKGPVILFGAGEDLNSPLKGFDLLRVALAKLRAMRPKRPPHVVTFGGAVARRGLEVDVLELGFISDQERLAKLYSAADMVIVPSRQEAFGQVAAEALACGTPVAAFAATGLLDIVVHEECGFLATPFDADDLARGMQWLLEHPCPKQLAEAARRRVEERFSLQKVGTAYAQLYAAINAGDRIGSI